MCFCCSVTKFLQTHGLQHTRPPCLSPSPRVHPSTCPLNRWCHPTISSSATLFSFCLQSFLASVFFSESALHIRWPKYWSFSFSIHPSNEYSGLISLRIDLGLILRSPRDSQESSLAPQVKSINSSVFSLLYGSTFTSTHDYWKNHNFDNTDLCRQSDVYAI